MRPVAIHDPFTGPAQDCFESWLETVLLGDHPLLKEVRALILRAARADLPILITGETGTGKDIVARAIHRGSSRGTRKICVVALSGLGETAWSALFGHKRGAFTGSTRDHEGIFATAHRSTLLFDDIDTAPLDLQPMLLRAIEHGAYRPLGAVQEKRSDVRVLATSNAPLEREIAAGRFRADLYQRLSVLRIVLPPLRDHSQDLEIYVPHFLKKVAAQGHPPKTVSRKGMKALLDYSWPRNVRELEHVLYRASVEITAPVLGADEVKRLLEGGSSSDAKPPGRPRRVVVERSELEEALGQSWGNKREAARRLGISPSLLYKLIEQHGIVIPKRTPKTGRNVP